MRPTIAHARAHYTCDGPHDTFLRRVVQRCSYTAGRAVCTCDASHGNMRCYDWRANCSVLLILVIGLIIHPHDSDRNRPLHNPTTSRPAHVVQRDLVPEGQILDRQDTPVPASSCTHPYRYPLLQRCLLQGLHVYPVLVVCIHNDRCDTHTCHAPNCCCCT